jgi:6-phosphogluconolactonase (cycloisomerase 2 family)
MIDRRTFSTLLASSVAFPSILWAQGSVTKMALYSGVGTALTHYDVDVDGAVLNKRRSTDLPSSIQYAWPHPSRKFLYVSSSSGGPGQSGNNHHLTVFKIDPATGALAAHGKPTPLRSRPVHNSVDMEGKYALVAFNEPAGLAVYRIDPAGTIGEEIKEPQNLDVGIYAHQIRATPSNQSVTLVTRGNNATASRPEDPGSIKVFQFKDGVLTNKQAVQPGNGLGFGPRHLDFHPTKPWVFVSIERQNQIYVYRLLPDGGLPPDPLFVKFTVLDRSKRVSTAGPIHVHPNGRFVYVGNRGGWVGSAPGPGREMFEGLPVFSESYSSIAVFAIDQETGEPSLIQTMDAHGAHPRTFSFDASARMLVAGHLVPVAIREADKVTIVPAGLAVFRMGSDGKLEFVRKYDVDTGTTTQWWTGMVALS